MRAARIRNAVAFFNTRNMMRRCFLLVIVATMATIGDAAANSTGRPNNEILDCVWCMQECRQLGHCIRER